MTTSAISTQGTSETTVAERPARRRPSPRDAEAIHQGAMLHPEHERAVSRAPVAHGDAPGGHHAVARAVRRGPLAPWLDAVDYAWDAWQRSILYLDVMRERGNQYRDYMARRTPGVLMFDAEVLVDGRTLEHPCNYGLTRILPPPGTETDPKKRPYVVIDPRAGHRPGIGGFKADSEIGVALAAGHPCYFVGFLPEPVPGQTIEDVMAAEAVFLETVIARHPGAEGLPVVVGNCQAGWAVTMLAAVRPELFGPIILAGSPLSFWAGHKGGSPMRYMGGLIGGSWMTALTGDLGRGLFDGAWLVTNFEALNPANTLWTKQFNLWADVDEEALRYLGFERWWGGHIDLNAEEMQFIVDELFVGNRLATAEIVTRDGVRIDLRSIRSPIVVFCSRGDDITPPPQALGWITDLYENDDDLIGSGQTIVYTVHDSTGHLGIFVSGSVVRREHQEFANNIELIDCLPPGLYEMVLSPADPGSEQAARGEPWIARFEGRTLADVRELVGANEEDERAFAAVRQISDANLGLYRTLLQPIVRASITEPGTAWRHALQPSRLPFELFSDTHPLAPMVKRAAERVRAHRRAAAPDNPLLAAQTLVSKAAVTALDLYRDRRNAAAEALFYAIYGAPLVQALAGLKASDTAPRRHPGLMPEAVATRRERRTALMARIAEGDTREAAIRAALYVGRGSLAIDERMFEVVRAVRAETADDESQEDFKRRLREQYLMLEFDEVAALAALPKLLPADEAARRSLLGLIERVLTAAGPLTDVARRRLDHVAALFLS